MSPYSALPTVAPFPPAELPAFSGTTWRSDSLRPFAFLPSSGCPAYSPLRKGGILQGLPSCRAVALSCMPRSPTPGKLPPQALRGIRFDFGLNKSLVLSLFTISELNPFTLSDFGLHARRPTHKVGNYFPPSKGLATWWLAKPSRAGVAPAKLHDLARSHLSIRVPFFRAVRSEHRRCGTANLKCV